MARPSKTQKFAVYQDYKEGTYIPPTPPDVDDPPFDHNYWTQTAHEEERAGQQVDKEESVLVDVDETIDNLEPTDTEVDDDRRESAISSLPESSTETDHEQSLSVYKSYKSPLARPSFRRTTPFERSPRRTVLSRSRTGTPRSVKSNARGSPLPRKRQEEQGDERREYPLVLLHVTLLPVELRWSTESMEAVLPSHILENLQLLRSKVSETTLQRGILIPHPREEYELLEERLLEALELKKERLTKCGHFRARDSTSSASSAESGDSGIAFHNSDAECMTCHGHIKGTSVGSGKQKWSIKVYAANGLMRASAWAAAWSEMERVDIEILPWIDEELRRKLDAKMQEEYEDEQQQREEEEAHIRAVVEEQVRIAHEEKKRADEEERRRQGLDLDVRDVQSEMAMIEQYSHYSTPHSTEPAADPEHDLPPVYRSRDVPLSLLLKNYLFLLAQDSKNIVILGLALIALWMGLRTVLVPATVEISAASGVACEQSNDSIFPLAGELDAAEMISTVVPERARVPVEANETSGQDDFEPIEAALEVARENDSPAFVQHSESQGVLSIAHDGMHVSLTAQIAETLTGTCENIALPSRIFSSNSVPAVLA